MKYLIVCVLALIIFLTGCSIQFREDLTNRPEFENLRDKCLELKKDVFLVQYKVQGSDTKIYTLEVPGNFSDIPPTTDAFLENPKAWIKEFHKVVGIVPAGTKLYLYNIVHMSGLATSTTRYFAKIDDPRYSHISVDLKFLINKDFLNGNYTIEDKYLKYCE